MSSIDASDLKCWFEPSIKSDSVVVSIDNKGEKLRTNGDVTSVNIEENAIDELFSVHLKLFDDKMKGTQVLNPSLKSMQFDDKEEKLFSTISKGINEITQLLDVTAMLKSKKHMLLQTCNRSNLTNANDKSGGVQAKGYVLPTLSQRLKFKCDDYRLGHDILVDGIEQITERLSRKTYIQELIALKKGVHGNQGQDQGGVLFNWRLCSLENMHNNNQNMVLNNIVSIGIDCSYHPSTGFDQTCSGDEINSLGFVPLVQQISTDRSLTIQPVKTPKTFYTVRLNILNSAGCTIGSASLWNILQDYYSKSRANATSDLHQYCATVQHDILAQKLFFNIQKDARNDSGTCCAGGKDTKFKYMHVCHLIQKIVTSNEGVIGVQSESTNASFDGFSPDVDKFIKNNIMGGFNVSSWARSHHSCLNNNTLVIQAVGTTNVLLRLTSHYSLEIELIPISHVKDGEASKSRCLAYTLYNILQVMLKEWDKSLITSNEWSGWEAHVPYCLIVILIFLCKSITI